MAKQRKGRSTPQGDIKDVSAFRRAIHASQNLVLGLRKNRLHLKTDAVHAAVTELMQQPIYRGIIASNAFPTSFKSIKGRFALSIVEDEKELIWASSVLAAFADELNEFISIRDQYTREMLRGSFAEAGRLLVSIEQKFGLSMWLISNKITLLHYTDGVKSHKKFINEILSAKPINPLIAYLSYLFSYSIEEGVSISDLTNEFRDTRGHLYDYLQYHLLPSFLSHVTDPIRSINFEENSPIIDRFETFVEMSQLLFVRGKLLPAIRASLLLVARIDDPRLKNMAFMLDINCEPFIDNMLPSICDMYTTGQYRESADLAKKRTHEGAGNPHCYELYSRSLTAAGLPLDSSGPAKEVVEELLAFGEIKRDLNEIRGRISRIIILSRKLPLARSLCAMLDRKVEPIVRQSYSDNEKLWTLCAPLNQPQNFNIIRSLNASGYSGLIQINDCKSLTARMHDAVVRGDIVEIEGLASNGLPKVRGLLFAAYGAFNNGQVDEAIRYFEEFEKASLEGISPRAVAFHYTILKEKNKQDRVFSAFSDAYVANERLHSLFPMQELAASAVSQASADQHAISRSILLHAYSQHLDSSFDGFISDAFEDVLDFYDTDFPYDLIGQEVASRTLIYFLRHIATIDRLEDTTRFASLDAIEAERMRILQWLVANDTPSRAVYTQEISNITKDQEVARLSAEFERSKIYVHEEGLRRTFDSELKADFFRFRQLVADPKAAGEAAEIQQALKRILKESADGITFFIIPSTETDQMFESLFTKAFQVIIRDPNHGFKTYLSTRILHGVIEGELRSSFVKERIIFPTDINGAEQFLQSWSLALSDVGEASMKALGENVAKFSSKIVDAILDLKDRQIRVADATEKRAIFRFDVTSEEYSRVRSSITPTTTYEEFLDRLMAAFWESMDKCLEEVKKELNTTFRDRVLAAFQSFEIALVRESSAGDISTLTDAVTRCKTSFLRDLERVTSWFGRAGIQSRNPFLLETAIQVATRITNNCYPTYPLVPKFEQDRPHKIAGELLNPIVDLLTNCLQNAAEHSGIDDRSPQASIEISRHGTGDIEVDVMTELGEAVSVSKCGDEMRELLNERDDLNPTAVAGERRSGIRKMKRIVKHDLRSERRLAISVSDNERAVCVSFGIPARFADEHCAN